jgi:hypothetical protein
MKKIADCADSLWAGCRFGEDLWSRGMFPDVIESLAVETDPRSQAVNLEIARYGKPQGTQKKEGGGRI